MKSPFCGLLGWAPCVEAFRKARRITWVGIWVGEPLFSWSREGSSPHKYLKLVAQDSHALTDVVVLAVALANRLQAQLEIPLLKYIPHYGGHTSWALEGVISPFHSPIHTCLHTYTYTPMENFRIFPTSHILNVWTFRGVLTVSLNIVMDLNNVMGVNYNHRKMYVMYEVMS